MNWFEDHAAFTIVGHTILVAGVTWAVSRFVLDQRRIEKQDLPGIVWERSLSENVMGSVGKEIESTEMEHDHGFEVAIVAVTTSLPLHALNE